MKFNVWLQKEGWSQNKFQAEAEELGFAVSQSAIAKWSCGQRIPRKDEMQMIVKLTKSEVNANDFYDV